MKKDLCQKLLCKLWQKLGTYAFDAHTHELGDKKKRFPSYLDTVYVVFCVFFSSLFFFPLSFPRTLIFHRDGRVENVFC